MLFRSELGSDNLELAYALTGLGLSYLADNNATAALVPLERAFKIRSTKEKEPSRRAETAFGLARALWDSHRDRVRARDLAERARTDYGRTPAASKVADIERWLKEREPS